MADISKRSVTPERHQYKGWRRPTSLAHAAHQAVLPIAGAELAKIAVEFPIAFLLQDKQFLPVAVVGLTPNHSLFVSPGGMWEGKYIPASLRGHPFSLVQAEDGHHVLCVDEASELLTDLPEGEPFFLPGGAISEPTKAIFEFLAEVERERISVLAACRSLGRREVMDPWPISIDDGRTGTAAGLYQINEAKLAALDDDSFLDLRRTGALIVAYAHLLSVQNMPILMARQKERAADQSRSELMHLLDPGGTSDLSFLKGDTLRFS